MYRHPLPMPGHSFATLEASRSWRRAADGKPEWLSKAQSTSNRQHMTKIMNLFYGF
jgi:hypothetical protein